ncbi:MAG: YtcA family lipoprotein [Acidobacteriaceae bacterium]
MKPTVKHTKKAGIAGAFLLASVATLPLTLTMGCERAPEFNIVGSFFPDWLFCAAAGIVLAFITHRIFQRTGMDRQVAWPVLVYLFLPILFACTLWLVFFSYIF